MDVDFGDYLAELADGSVRLRVAGLKQLSSMTREQAAEFSSVWPGIDVRRRRRLVQELADLAEDNIDLDFDAVFFRGLDDEDADVRLESVRGLWEHDGTDLIAPLLRVLGADPSPGVRAEAALALGRFVMLSEMGRLRERYFHDVERGLRRVLEDHREVEEVRARALEAMGPFDGAWVRQAIREAYESGVRRLKASALYAMGRSCQPRWLPLMLRELASEEAELRYEAAVACGEMADEAAVPHLVPLLSDGDEEVRAAAVAALGEIGGAEAKAALVSLVEGPSSPLREAAVAALAGIDFGEDPLGLRFR
jgi:HEAT repeat protein